MKLGHDRRAVTLVGVAAAVTLVVVAAWAVTLSGRAPAPSPTFTIRDATQYLGPVFHPGVILGAASNGSAILAGGIGVYVRSPEFTLPVLAEITNGSSGVDVTNLTPAVNSEFFDGGVYGIGWNGSSWLVAGQASWGGVNFGSVVAIRNGVVSNLTDRILPYFKGGGVFALGWNGTSWLLGGNSSAGPALVAFDGARSVDLAARLVSYDPLGWIQLLNWNGDAWLIGGEGLLGTLSGSTFTDLWLQSPYQGAGVYTAAWTGTVWIIGGGAGKLVFLQGSSLSPGPVLPAPFDQAVLLITPVLDGWLIGGKGSGLHGGIAAELAFWPGPHATTPMTNLSQELPATFDRGEVQGGCPAPIFGPTSILMVGEGGYDSGTGYGLGSLAVLSAS